MTPVTAIVTVPPYATFLEEVAAHPIVSGLRLNTVMPIHGDLRDTLRRLRDLGKPLFIDLKARQLRVVGAAIPPFTELRVSHPLRVRTPVTAYFSDGREEATVVSVEGDRLILADGPRRLIGPGESVNIPSATLEIDGGLTETDRRFVEAARALGIHDYMLSFVESPADLDELRRLDPEARIVAKIESKKGLDYAAAHRATHGRLMAARGDLYVEVGRPHRLLTALKTIAANDPDAIAASRIFPSLARDLVPSAQDLTDVAYLTTLGYRTFMLGDEVCLREDSVIAALNALSSCARELGLPCA